MFTFKVPKRFWKTFGSWARTTPPRPKPRPTFKPRLEALEERWCPDVSYDTLMWNPAAGSQNAAIGTNWFDVTTGQQIKQGQLLNGPTSTNPIELDGGKSNSQIEITQVMSVASITVQSNYNNTLTVDANDSLSTSGGGTIQNGSILTLVSSSYDGGIVLHNGSNFTVSSGATLNLKDPVNPPAGVTYLSGDGVQGEYLNNQGNVNWYGTAVAAGNPAIVDNISVPVSNIGTFNANGGSGGDTTMVGGQLGINGSDPNTNNVSYYQSTGALNLTNNAEVACTKGYYQSGGAITSDATPCTLSSGSDNNGDINLFGGIVVVDNVAGSVSTLTFLAATVEINCEIDVNGLTTGGNSTRSDQLICTGSVYLNAEFSYLNVGTTGSGALGTGNRWTVMKYASIYGSWAGWSVPTGMSVSTGATDVLVSN